MDVSFTQAERDKINILAESGRLFEAQNLILAKVRDQIGAAGTPTANSTNPSADNEQDGRIKLNIESAF